MTVQVVQADATQLPLADKSVDLTIGSPPYLWRRTYDDGTLPIGHSVQRDCDEWVEWMVLATKESLRVSRGPVLWVVSGAVRKRAYYPACEGLVWECWKRGITVERPLIWKSNKAPSRHGDWWTNSWEYVIAFKHPGRLPYFDWEATATKTKYATAGAFRQRRVNGSRPVRTKKYVAPELAHPRDVIFAPVGGGHLGGKIAHANEAPYPERLVEQIIPVLCPPEGIVLDPFSGSGTTAKVATVLGRSAIAADLRTSQCELTRRRVSNVQVVLF